MHRGRVDDAHTADHQRSIRRGLAKLALAGAISGAMINTGTAQSIDFWTQPIGDLLVYQDLMGALSSEFKSESGIDVKVEIINWSVAFNTWLTVSQGGAAPDCGDMYWLHSFSGIGGGKFGPRPITEYKDQWPNLESDFFDGALEDVHWNGEFYGIPWRVELRPMMYRTDLLKEAGFSEPPATWEEIVEIGKALTIRDGDHVTRWGFAPGVTNPAQVLLPYYWQAGGQMLSEDGKTATIDNEAMRTALTFLHDLVWVHKITSPEIFEKSSDPLADFTSGSVAINGSAGNAWPSQLDRDYPELDGKWALALNPQGPVNRDSYSGSGYWGVLYGSDQVDACVEWIKFLSREENMQRVSEATGGASPRRAVMNSQFWTARPWQKVMGETLEYAHTSQHPSSVWSALASPEPGAVIYDLIYSTVIGQQDIDTAIATAQSRMQAELDRAGTK